MPELTVVSYGGGTNSTAMLVGLYERGERPDAILFADTGGEKPHTYNHILVIDEWCRDNGFPTITVVRSPNKLLEQDCLDRKALPSVAYGYKTCSQRWKREPQDKWMLANGFRDATKLIGFDADEDRRAKPYPNVRYPLIEWGWGRDECVDAIERTGLQQPGKSACFFCPSSKKHEILDLRSRYPELMERALVMEANAELTSIKGLGRDFSWAQFLKWTDAQQEIFCDSLIEEPCECYDG